MRNAASGPRLLPCSRHGTVDRVQKRGASVLKGIWRRLVGSGNAAPADKPAFETVEYKGYRIRPAPYAASSGYQTAGVIEKDAGEGVQEHRFIRAETHPSLEEAAAFATAKAKQIIDQQGDALFRERRPAPPD